jgi:hypothetical protein
MSLLGSLFKNGQASVVQEIKTILDLVTYTAGLASNPTDIDPLLDDVRKITALHSLDEELSSNDERTLVNVYLSLEDYLATRDPIRTYTKSELRSRLSSDIVQKLSTYEVQGGA